MFEVAADGRSHGNFLPDSWRAIVSNTSWSARLEKAHQRGRALPPEKTGSARELDSSNSSDALLMNCFCYPDAALCILTGLDLVDGGLAEFGVKASLPLTDGNTDGTEIDMRIGSNLIEAKLTEKNFTTCTRSHVLRYIDLDLHFDVNALPLQQDELVGYQLIRNVLAAARSEASFTVLLDQRRPDLLQEWWQVHAAIRNASLRARCGFRTWQQVAAASPAPLAQFLATKYGL
jgi:hypothetical protein